MKIVLLSICAVTCFCSITAATISEPDIIFYGRILKAGTPADGAVNASPEGVDDGTLVWTIQPSVGSSFQVATDIEPVEGTVYQYSIQIPVEKLPDGEANGTGDAVISTDADQTVNRATVTLDGQALYIVGQSGSTADTFTFGVNNRGLIERVDLSFDPEVSDWDADGLPDAYEELFADVMVGVENDDLGLNNNSNDADGDMDGDGKSNLQEYLNGDDPYGLTYNEWIQMHGFSLADPLAAFDADADGDGLANCLEFALEGDPNVDDGQLLEQAMISLSATISNMTYQVSLPGVFAPRRNGILRSIEYSSDMKTWSGNGLAMDEDSDDLLSATKPLSGSDRAFFFVFKVTEE
ncbi:hypothetical protein [Cerasicoccus frondis]|uniref:hypothetical protein n=1 Tax=Cerasicoccus frondis TaxID=490090 RepID=UPI002852B2CB|nr:hypothetical protein [Cerasicoccus frondis]